MDWTLLGTTIGTPLLRSVLGWAENAFKESSHGGKNITSFELRQLGQTFFRVGLISLATYAGLNSIGIDVEPIAAGAAALLFDFLLHAIKR